MACSEDEIRRGVVSLRELGVEILGVPGKGYRLAGRFDALDQNKLRALLKPHSPAVMIEVVDEIASTNDYLLSHAESFASGRACIAEIQTAGRGRRGRSWFAAPGASLAFSMLWRFERELDFLSGLSLAAGVAVARVLHELGAREVRLKWPNDVLYRQHKLAGILVETQGGNRSCVAVVGIGINLTLPPAVRGRIDQAVTDLAAAVPTIPGRNVLASLLLRELASVLGEFARGGFSALREEWSSLHAYQGRAVRLRGSGDEGALGRVLGVAADGALLLDTGAGEQRFYSGEISLRAA
ncbi:MAG: biotin--[acetyl-CoA-carboxylase] ligase [Rhodospirillales bacterium]